MLLTALLTALVNATLAAPPVRLDLSRGVPTAEKLTIRIDPKAPTFSGAADISLHLPPGARSIDLNAVDLSITSATLDVGGNPRAVRVSGSGQTRTFSWVGAVSGDVVLSLVYTGKVIPDETQGIFHEKEGDDDYVYTQFEAIDARRAFPCFDEPDVKIPWTVSVRIPQSDGAYGNMPVTSDTPDPVGHLVTFAPTPPLPSYLVAFAIGPFDVVPAADSVGPRGVKTPVRIIVPRGQAGMAGYAAASTPEILNRLQAWFDIPYAFPKLDVVAMPEAVGFSAMENAGLVTVGQSIVTVRPEDDSVEHDRDYADTLAHELAHMWFGDYVTMNFWDDVWLNESFASWMATKTVDAWHPEWQESVGRVGSRDGAMAEDSLGTSRRIRQPIVHTEDIEDAFDGITYQKGEAILEMYEAWLGPDVFRTAVQAYLRGHALGNATADDFIAALATASGQPIQASFAGFLTQVGVPLLDVTLNCPATGAPSVRLLQSRYQPMGGHGAAESWQVPYCLRYGEGDESKRQCGILADVAADVPLQGTCPTWLIPDDNASGYYHVRLQGSLADDPLLQSAPLSLPERVGALGDANALVKSGDLLPTVVLAQVPALVALGEPEVTGETVWIVRSLDAHLVPDDLRPNYERFVLATYGPIARKLGLTPSPADPAALRDLRADVVGMAGQAGDQDIITAARTATDRWLGDRTGIDPSMVSVLLATAARHGDEALFDRLHAEAKKETDRNRRQLLLGALGDFTDPDIARNALSLAISGEFDIREALGLLIGPLTHRQTRDVAWSWLKANIKPVTKAVPAIARGYIPMSAQGFCDAARSADVRAFFTPRVKGWVGGRHHLAETLETIDDCAALAAKEAPDVRAFLQAQ